MIEIIYFLSFSFFGSLFILLKSVKLGELSIEVKFVKQVANYNIYIKGIPALLTMIFVYLNRSNDSLFYFGLIIALIFCLAGDLGMERGLIPGLPLFLIALIFFSISFVGQALTQGLNINSFILGILTFLCVVIYVVLFVRYLDSSESGLGKFKIPVIIYCAAISSMFVSSVILWTTLGFLEYLQFGLVSLGGLLFIFSDSVIALREFREIKLSKDVLVVMVTYFSAIFLLSLSSILI